MAASSSASTSASALRSAMRPRVVAQGIAQRMGSRQAEVMASRSFAAAAQQQPLEPSDLSPSYTQSQSQSQSQSTSHLTRPPSIAPITSESAQSYLSDLLHLPPSRAFSPDLSLQILTHKSYRYAHLIRNPQSHSLGRYRSNSRGDFGTRPEAPSEAEGPSSVSHNARLSFLGRRAMTTYLTLFLHSNLRTDRGLREVDFLRGKGLDEKIKAMTHVNNLGREVGSRWGVGDVMRWDRNETGKPGENLKIKGLTVEAILGGVFTEMGSSAAQRAFHLHVLPHLSDQLRDPMLLERAEKLRGEVKGELGGGVVGDLAP